MSKDEKKAGVVNTPTPPMGNPPGPNREQDRTHLLGNVNKSVQIALEYVKVNKTNMPDQVVWDITRLIVDGFTRDQQVKLSKAVTAQFGALVSYPNSRESALRKELVKQANKSVQTSNRPKAKAENAAMKGSAEEKDLHAAQKALRDKRISLGLAKNDLADPRIQKEVSLVKEKNTLFQNKKAAIRAMAQ